MEIRVMMKLEGHCDPEFDEELEVDEHSRVSVPPLGMCVKENNTIENVKAMERR